MKLIGILYVSGEARAVISIEENETAAKMETWLVSQLKNHAEYLRTKSENVGKHITMAVKQETITKKGKV